MKKVVRVAKWLGLGVGLVVVLLITVGSVRLAGAVDVPDHPVTVDATGGTDAVEGRRLVEALVCTECHGDDLAGTDFVDAGPFMKLPAPNLTGRRFDDVQLERAVRHGIGSDGRALLIMPSEAFADMSEADFSTIARYLATLPNVERELIHRSVGPVGRAVAAFQAPIFQPARRIEHATTHPATTTGAVARYTPLCMVCHGADFGGQVVVADYEHWAPNLTSHSTGATSWSLEEFGRAVRTGSTPDGRRLVATEMPWQAFASMSDEEVESLYAFLRALPAVDRPRPPGM